MTLSEVENKLMAVLIPLYGNREASLMTDMVIENLTSWDRTVARTMLHHEVSETIIEKLEEYIAALSQSVPIQYVLGYAWFYHMQLQVNAHVLIPRPETEELVDRIVKEGKRTSNKLVVLDLGTGSGCIPLGIKKGLPVAQVFGCDVSEEALKVAKQNAMHQQLDISFFKYDILSGDHLPLDQQLDIMVSNPPYIPFSEKDSMHKNVKDHEPALALFVHDSDPLIFYKKIAQLGIRHLKKGGSLYFEIHESMAMDIQQLLTDFNYENIKVCQDLQGKDRIVIAKWP